jgi:hypothetical protein
MEDPSDAVIKLQRHVQRILLWALNLLNICDQEFPYKPHEFFPFQNVANRQKASIDTSIASDIHNR